MKNKYFINKDLLINLITARCRYISKFCEIIGITRQSFYEYISIAHQTKTSSLLDKILEGLYSLYPGVSEEKIREDIWK